MDWTWVDGAALCVEGRGWRDTEGPFDRLPARAKGRVREVIWNLSRHTTGVTVRFVTDAVELRARWRLADPAPGAVHTPLLAYSGLDLYAREPAGRWRWVGVSNEVQGAAPESSLTPWGRLAPGRREYRLYLPVFNAVERLEIGVPAGAAVVAAAPRAERPVAYYGTSIVHGAGASRPGMTQAAILGRRLDYPLLNLGFAGNAHMEPEIAGLLAELDPAVYILDPVPNMNAAAIAERAEAFVRTLSAARPGTPIVLVEDRTYPAAWLTPAVAEENRTRRQAFRRVFADLVAAGVAPMHYLEGDALLGWDGEGTNDGSHANDLGAMRMADALEPVVRRALGLPV